MMKNSVELENDNVNLRKRLKVNQIILHDLLRLIMIERMCPNI